MSDWQIFDTAPRNGVEILAWFSKSRYHEIVSWADYECDDEGLIKAWQDQDGRRIGGMTHWQPLIDGPAD